MNARFSRQSIGKCACLRDRSDPWLIARVLRTSMHEAGSDEPLHIMKNIYPLDWPKILEIISDM